MLLTIDQLLPRSETIEFARRLTKADWQDGKKTAGSQAMTVKSNLQLDDQSALAIQLRQLLLQKLAAHPLFISAALPNAIFPPKFNCYQNGGHYGQHVDNALMTLPDGRFIRTDISATLFLTEPQSYEGGELMIESQYGAQSVKLNAGDLVLYPSTSLHEVKPVTSGQRICAFFWVQSLVRDSIQREQLFELDQSIQSLTQEIGVSHPEVRRLTGIYHNLLRSWTQP